MKKETYVPPITALSKGWLCRAYVGLPPELTRQAHSQVTERLVFFEAPKLENLGAYLENLLEHLWQTPGDRLDIYNAYHVDAWMRERAFGEEATGELRMLEGGFGSDGVGADGIRYHRPHDEIDLFVTPLVAERLHALLAQVEAMYKQAGK